MDTTTPTSATVPSVPVKENLFAPEVFATEASFFSIAHGNVSVALTSVRWDSSASPQSPTKVVVCRIVLPIDGAKALAAGLYDFLSRQGHAPVGKPSDTAQVQ